jgi:hypothetical protein
LGCSINQASVSQAPATRRNIRKSDLLSRIHRRRGLHRIIYKSEIETS